MIEKIHPLHGEIAYQCFAHKKDISDRTALILQNTTLLKVGTTPIKHHKTSNYCSVWIQVPQNNITYSDL